MKKYRITFHNGPMESGSQHYDIIAENMDDAFTKAYRMSAAKKYKEVGIQEVEDGPEMIGLEIIYTDTYFKQDYHAYLIIKANTEKEAVEYYNRNLKGGKFWFNAGKTDSTGKCIRGRVVNTYYAACPGCDFDATA